MVQLDETRKLAAPEYRNDGCHVAPSCLDCPLPQCWYEMPKGEREAYRRMAERGKGGRSTAPGEAGRPGPAGRSGWVIDEAKVVALVQTGQAGQRPETGKDRGKLAVNNCYRPILQQPAETAVAALPVVPSRPLSAETLRAYSTYWLRWQSWAQSRGLEPLPADPAQVAGFITDLAEAGVRIATVRMALAALKAVHRDAGLPDPTTGDELRRVWKELRSADREVQRQPTGLTQQLLARIRATAARPRTNRDGKRESPERALARGRTDVVLVSLMRDAMLRPGEASWVTWGAIALKPDGSGTLRVRRGEPEMEEEVYLGPPTMQALAALRPAGAAPHHYVVDLSRPQITRRIQAAAKAAGLEGFFNGDSPRLGMAQDLEELPGKVALYYALARLIGGPPTLSRVVRSA